MEVPLSPEDTTLPQFTENEHKMMEATGKAFDVMEARLRDLYQAMINIENREFALELVTTKFMKDYKKEDFAYYFKHTEYHQTLRLMSIKEIRPSTGSVEIDIAEDAHGTGINITTCSMDNSIFCSEGTESFLGDENFHCPTCEKFMEKTGKKVEPGYGCPHKLFLLYSCGWAKLPEPLPPNTPEFLTNEKLKDWVDSFRTGSFVM